MTADVRVVRADDPTLRWDGAIEVEHTPEWSRGWRLPLSRIGLFPGDELQRAAALQAGVRVVFSTDSGHVGGRFHLGDDVEPGTVIDIMINSGDPQPLTTDEGGAFSSGELPAGQKTIEVWLPHGTDLRLVELTLDPAATLAAAPPAEKPRLIVYGSSISQCHAARTPTQTWPALVARELDLDLTCLGFSGQCHLDPMVGRLIRDLPADVIVTCLGINVHRPGTYKHRTFLPAVLGLLATIRDGHPNTPIVVISPICSPDREEVVGDGDMTLSEVRNYVGEAVRLLTEHGDPAIRLLNGLDVIGPDQAASLLHDGVHPHPEGYRVMAQRIGPAVAAGLSATD